MRVKNLKEVLREAYKQGYVNACADNRNGELQLDESDYDDWVSEVGSEMEVGDIKIKVEL